MVRRMAYPGRIVGSSLSVALFCAASLGACAEGTDTSKGADAGNLVPSDSGTDAPDAAPTPCADSPCFESVECTEDGADYVCGDCPTGLSGDGASCTEIDGCAEAPCFDSVECVDAAAPEEGYSCGDCPIGFFGNGEVCTDVDDCEGEPCFPGAECTDALAPEVGFTCGECPTGFEGDGFSCNDIDGCSTTPCFDGVECTDAIAPQLGFSCGDCPTGTVGDGEDCDLLCEPLGALTCGSTINGDSAGVGSADNVDNWECSGISHTGPEVIYTFVAGSTGIATARLTGLSADLDLMVIEDASAGNFCDPLDGTVCVPGGISGETGTTDEEMRFNAVAGTTYFVIVDGFAGASSTFNLTMESATEDFLLNEIAYGTADFVEIRNHGACSADFAGLGISHKASLDTVSQSFVFPAGSDVAPGGVMRWVESNSAPYLANEIDAGESIVDVPAGAGSTLLCNGACDLAACTNVIDYVERDDDTADTDLPGGPACATFSPAPIDSTGQTGDISLRRAAFTGVGGPFQVADWVFANTTRD